MLIFYLLLAVILIGFPLALIIRSIRCKRIGGVISVIGAISLILSSFKLFVVEHMVEYMKKQISSGFPAGVADGVSPAVSTAEVVQSAANPDLIWFIVSIVVFIIGLVWLTIELINERKAREYAR